MNITAGGKDKKVIFTACSDAPHKRSFRMNGVQRVRYRYGRSEWESPDGKAETLE
jgi:hypothetical protein